MIGNLMWGSGLDGLAGIATRRGTLIRPLLDVSRGETRELATLLGLPFLDDPANQDDAYRRVRIRRAAAEWESRLAPGMSRRLAQTAGLVRHEVDFLESLIDETSLESVESAARIPASVLRTLPPALAHRLARRALRAVGGGQPGTQRDVDAVMSVAHGGRPSEVSGGHRVAREGVFVQIGGVGAGQAAAVDLALPGSTRWGQWAWTATSHEGRPSSYSLSPWTQVFDAGLFADGQIPRIRSIAPRDVVAMRAGHKGAMESMAEAEIAASERQAWPVLEISDEVLWIPGVRRAFSGWVTGDTGRYLVVTALREEHWKPVAS